MNVNGYAFSSFSDTDWKSTNESISSSRAKIQIDGRGLNKPTAGGDSTQMKMEEGGWFILLPAYLKTPAMSDTWEVSDSPKY